MATVTNAIEQQTESAPRARPTSFFPLCDELDELNVYTRRYHHGENPDANRANKMTASFTAMCAARWN